MEKKGKYSFLSGGDEKEKKSSGRITILKYGVFNRRFTGKF